MIKQGQLVFADAVLQNLVNHRERTVCLFEMPILEPVLKAGNQCLHSLSSITQATGRAASRSTAVVTPNLNNTCHSQVSKFNCHKHHRDFCLRNLATLACTVLNIF
jgi:hypothetical protein